MFADLIMLFNALAKIGSTLGWVIACRGVKIHKLPLEMRAQWRDIGMTFGPERICLR